MRQIVKLAKVYRDQFGFQREHSRGRILNVGSNTDGAALQRDFGALNLDVRDLDQASGLTMPIDVLGDARALPFRPVFDTVVLGELLEHMEQRDGIAALIQARGSLAPGGRVVITMPHDGRRDSGELEEPAQKFYAPGVYAFHYRSISQLELLSWILAAGLEARCVARIVYVWGESGSGIVCQRRGEA